MEPMYLSIPARGNREADKAAAFGAKLYDPRDPRVRSALKTHRQSISGSPEKSLPSLDNFIILSRLLHTSIENILVIDGDIFLVYGSV